MRAAQNYNPYSGAPTPSRDEREDKAWRYLGYPTVAKLMGSSSDIFVLRRFDELHARVQLYSQDQIVRLEQELFQLDELCRRAPEDKFSFNNSIRPGMDPQPRRLEILAQLQFMLREYGASSVFRSLTESQLKSSRSVCIGILRIAKEIYSTGLSNRKSSSIFSEIPRRD